MEQLFCVRCGSILTKVKGGWKCLECNEQDVIIIKKSVILSLIEDLKEIPCTFWACDGKAEEFESMVTCAKCAAIIKIKTLIT